MFTKRIRIETGAPVYHCIGRIVGGALLLGDEEKEYFRRLMWRLAEFSGVEIITYCVMSNHIHLLVRVPTGVELSDRGILERVVRYYGKREPWVQTIVESVRRDGSLPASVRERLLARMGNVSMFMRTLKQRFSKWYNRKYRRFGTLWAERFKSVLIEDCPDVLRTVAMYIDLNPARAGLVNDPKDYRYCGHAEAVAGNRAIRRETVALSEGSNWRQAVGEYRSRMMVYGAESNRADKRALSPKKVRQVLEQGGQVELGEVLRLKLRYFSDGLAFGSREFVEGVFEEFRDRFGAERRSGARKVKGVGQCLGEVATLRELQKAAS
ncbi:MAG: transposase [Limisphaerales bacterium]